MAWANFIQPYEEIWLEKNIINTYILDAGGRILNLTFEFEETSTGWLFILKLTLEKLKTLDETTTNLIMDKMEALTDDIGDDFNEVNLDIDDLEDFRVDILNE
jgi:hypothetical protein